LSYQKFANGSDLFGGLLGRKGGAVQFDLQNVLSKAEVESRAKSV
jgi:hypothetical protein